MSDLPLNFIAFGFVDRIIEPFCYGSAAFLLSYRISITPFKKMVAIIIGILCFLWMDDIWLNISLADGTTGFAFENQNLSELFGSAEKVGDAQFDSGERSGLYSMLHLNVWDVGSGILLIPFAYLLGLKITRRRWDESSSHEIGFKSNIQVNSQSQQSQTPGNQSIIGDEEMRIFIEKEYAPRQELSLEEVNHKLEIGELDGTENAWTAGQKEWTELNKISGVIIPQPPPTSKPNESPNANDRVIEGPLANQIKNNDEMQQPPPLIKKSNQVESEAALPLSKVNNPVINDISSESSNEFDVGQSYHPWRRLLARTVDLFSSGLLVFYIFSVFFTMLFPNSVEDFIALLNNPIAATMLIYLLWIPFEAAFISMLGTTPAKWVFGISVKSRTGGNLSYMSSLGRAFGVWIQGDAFSFFIATIITRLFAYRRLTTTGTTLWDISSGSTVSHEEWGAGRAIASTLSLVLISTIIGVLNQMG
jgi:uncharacterized RDD family membrane protein YckC